MKKTPICSPSTPVTPGMLWRCSACTAAAVRKSARSRPSRSGDRERALTGRACTKPEHALFVMLRFFDILKKAVFIPKCSFFRFLPVTSVTIALQIGTHIVIGNAGISFDKGVQIAPMSLGQTLQIVILL